MSLVVVLLPALATIPQDVREPVEIGASSWPSYSYSLVLASEDDLSVAAWQINADAAEPSADDLMLSISDGRGLAWSVPQTVEQAPAGVWVSAPRVSVVEERAFVCWADGRYGTSTGFLRVYDAATGTLGPEVEIPTGSPGASGGVGFLDAERVGAEVHVHVAFNTWVQPPGGPGYPQLVLATSIDAGASFLPPLVRPLPAPGPPPYGPFPTLVVQAESGVVHVMWLDRRHGMQTGKQQVFYQRSSDGGLSFDFSEDRQLTDLSYLLSFRFDARGSTLAFAADEVYSSDHYPGYDFADVSAAVSTDGGTTFGPVQSVPPGDGDPGLSWQPFNPAIAVGSGGEVALAWEAGFSSSSVNSARTVDGGATWSSEVVIAAYPDAEIPALVFAGPGRERAVVAWRGVGGKPNARLSSDAGATWGPAVELEAPMGKGSVRLAYNDRYQNLIAAWRANDSSNSVFIGGFRPQTLTPAGFTAGATQVGAAFERFDDGSPLAFLLVSTQAGDLQLPFGDPRNSGLGLTPLLLTTASLAASGSFAAPLDPAGAGALAPLPAVLPAGLTLYALGLSFDLATLSFGDVSDVVGIDL